MQEQPRILGLDIGDRRIGVAVSDGLGLTAQPVFTLHRSTLPADLRSLARLVRKHAVAEIVAGLPLHMSGELSPQAKKNQAFAQRFAERTGLPLHFWDERLSSHEANEILNQSRHNAADRKLMIDQVAAAVILQGFLDDRRQRTNNLQAKNL